MDLALKVLDVGNISVTRLLLHRLDSAETCHFKNAFLSDGGGLEMFLEKLVKQYPAAEGCISRAVGHDLTLKTVSAEMELVKSHALLSSTDITPHSMRDWTIGIPDHLAPCLSSILRASAVSDRAARENKVKKDTFTVRITPPAHGGTQPNLSVDRQCHHPPARELSFTKRTAVPGAVRTLAPCSRYTSRGN